MTLGDGLAWVAVSAFLWVGCHPGKAGAPVSNAVTQLEWQTLPTDARAPSCCPPMLEADNGGDVTLRSVNARALVIPPLAYTELELEFEPIPGQNKGAMFSLDLPSDAAVSRFAVADAGGFHDAEIVDAAQAQAVVSARAQPPTVRDASEPRHFSARVLRQATQAPRIFIAYAETLPTARAPYRIRLLGSAALDSLRVTVDVGSPQTRRYRLERASFTPDRDFVLGADHFGENAGTIAWRAGKYVVARIAPETTPSPELTFMVDTSLSEPVSLEHVSERLVALSEAVAKQQPELLISIIGFDQDIHPLLVRSRVPLSAAQLAPLRALGRLGGTDLAYADLASIEQHLPYDHLVMLSDLDNTIAPVSRSAVAHESEPRWDFLAANAALEAKLHQKLQGQGSIGDFPGVLMRLDADPTEIAQRLLEPTPSKVRLSMEGASWFSPMLTNYDSSSGQAPPVGRSVWAFAEVANSGPFKLIVGDKPLSLQQAKPDPALFALLGQVVGQARLSGVLGGERGIYLEGEPMPTLQAQVTSIAKAYGLLAPQSSFLVRAGAANSPALAGRAAAPLPEPPVIMTVWTPPEAVTRVSNEKCPDLIGLSNQRAAGGSCPPLYVGFGQAEARLVADIQFAPGSSRPTVAASPHLQQLVDLLALHSEVTRLTVKASTQARAEGVIQYLVDHGIAHGRLRAERFLPDTAPKRRATPNCKSPGETVVLDAQAMSAAQLAPAIVKKPVPPALASRSPLASIEELLRAARLKQDKPAIARARDLSERWVAAAPASPLPYIALGDTLRVRQDPEGAARAYGSLFDLDVPGAGLPSAAAARLAQLVPKMGRGSYNDGHGASEQRWLDLATALWTRPPQDPREHRSLELVRASAYSLLRAGQHKEALYEMHEAAGQSSIARRIELPVFAELISTQDSTALLESMLPADCVFPLRASTLGATVSWEDADSEFEVSVISVPGRYSYDSVLADHGAFGGVKWIPLPDDDASYPIRVIVRAERLGKNGYAFGVLRTLDDPGHGRARSAETPFVATQVGEPLMVLEEQILQRPQ